MKHNLKSGFFICSLIAMLAGGWFWLKADSTSGQPVGAVYNSNKVSRANSSAASQKMPAMSVAADVAVPEIFGSLVYSSDWSSLSEEDYPYGVYSLPTDSKKSVLKFASGLNPLTATLAGDKYYMVTRRFEYTGEIIQMYLHVFDINTWKMVEEYDLEPDWQYMPLVITYDRTDAQIYAITYSDDWTKHELAILDPNSGKMDYVATIGTVGVMPNIFTLSATDEGNLLAICDNGKLYNIDKSTGAMNLVGSTGYFPTGLQSTVFDYETKTLYWAGVMTNDESGLFTVDCNTGVAKKVYNFEPYEEYVGLYIMQNEYPDDVPQKPEAEFIFDADGSLTGTLEFTVPSKNNAGESLDTSLTMSITVDGTEITKYGETWNPGHSTTVPVSMTEGSHLIKVAAANEHGYGEAAYLNVYAGFDAPRPVKNLKLKISDDGLATLTWDNVDESVHGGYVDMESLRYKVLRADGSVAADNLAENSFSEQLPEIIQKYKYSVVAYTDDAQSTPVESNTIKFGDYYGVPYFEDFEDYVTVGKEYTIINSNADGDYYTWGLTRESNETGYVMAYNCNWDGPANDYVVTPEIYLEKEKFYRLSFQHMLNSEWMTYFNKIEIIAGRSSSIEDMDILIGTFQGLESNDTDVAECFFTLPESEMYNFAFRICSAAGQGVFWINDLKIEAVGMADAPEQVSFSLKADNSEPEKVTVTFTTPKYTAAGNPLSSLTAVNIYRNEETTPCYTLENPDCGVKYTWTDESPSPGLSHYRVVAVNESGESFTEAKNVFVGGFIPTFTETFDSAEQFDFYEILNLNNDDKTWSLIDGSVQYEYNISKYADDWFMSPAIKMNPNRVYKISFKAKTTIWANENLKMTVGTNQQPETHETLVELNNWMAEDYETHSAYFIPTEEKSYYVGFHAFSRLATIRIYVDEYTVEDAMSVDAPVGVEDLNIISGLKGALQATVEFTIPKTTADGRPLNDLERIDIYRNDYPERIESVIPDSDKVSFIDYQPKRGMNTYRIVPVNAAGEGMNVEGSVFVGYDIPVAVSDLAVKADADNANTTISWKAPEIGVNGGRIETAALRYTVYRTIYGEEEATEIATELTETTYVDNLDFRDDTQTIVTYAVVASTNEGTSSKDSEKIVLGSPYVFPFEESFAEQKIGTTPWRVSYMNTDACDFIVSGDYMTESLQLISSADSDNGFARFFKWNFDGESGKAMLISPKITIKESITPTLSFFVYISPNVGKTGTLTPYITVNDDERILLGEPIDVSNGEEGWTKFSYPLDDYIDADHFYLTLEAEIYSNSSSILIDNILFDDVLEHNLAINSFTAPANIISSGGRFTVEVKNRGLNDIAEYEVSLYCDGELVETKSGRNLKVGNKKSHTFKVEAPGIIDSGKIKRYHAEISYELDEKASDNVSETKEVNIYTPPYPAITDLSCSQNMTDNVISATLTWSEPSLDYYKAITEDFENAPLFAIDGVDHWKFVDMDHQRTVAPKYGVTFDYCFDPKAWQVIDPQRINMYGTDVAPYSGTRCLISMQSDGTLLTGETVEVCNDDWLISEEVAGGSEFAFWVMQPTNQYEGNEKFEVLYSTTDQETDSFKLIEEVELQDMATWHQYKYTLPADAKYFAIRHTLSFFGLWLDEITYHPVRKVQTLKISAYNIYRDGIKIGESDTTTYTDENLEDETYTYVVSTQFNLGESGPSNEIEIIVNHSSITDVDNQTANIGSRNQCITINNASGLQISIYSVDGKMIYNGVATDSISIPVDSGVYLVNVGKESCKILVK